MAVQVAQLVIIETLVLHQAIVEKKIDIIIHQWKLDFKVDTTSRNAILIQWQTAKNALVALPAATENQAIVMARRHDEAIRRGKLKIVHH